MEELRIECVQYSKGIMTHVQVNDELYPVSTIINWIRDKKYRLYTLEDGYKSYVFVKMSFLGNLFLATNPDGVTANNLSSMSCQ